MKSTSEPKRLDNIMPPPIRSAWALAAALFCAGAAAAEQADPQGSPGLALSPDTISLLREEMRALAGGIQALAVAIPTGDWQSAADTATRMEASYIMKQRLSPAQKQELAASLPGHFKRLDAAFHAQAGRLATAARRRDAELAAFHFYRLVDTCTACHAEHARARFQGFRDDRGDGHRH